MHYNFLVDVSRILDLLLVTLNSSNKEVKRLRSQNSDLSVTIGLRKHIGKTYKELPPELQGTKGEMKAWVTQTYILTNSASENIVELRPIFLPLVKGIHIRTLKELIEQLDEANKIFKIFYLQNVVYDNIQPDTNMLPIAFWNESKIRKFMKWLRFIGGIRSDKVKMHYVDTSGLFQQNIVGYTNNEEIIKKQYFASRILMRLGILDILEIRMSFVNLLNCDSLLEVMVDKGHSSTTQSNTLLCQEKRMD
ncbi:hypothetical protein WN944_016234 [Citrus x changshan-huyou]|uniref:Uncharacterized protein n=1 Tax=Citrus x changshan-huyou TaxID=2935761 RepID=A0AAP0QK76_9ROSI